MTTVPNSAEGESLAEKIVAAKLAACVQILPQMTSIYVWKGSVQKETEYLLLVKTLDEKYGDLERFITENHSFAVPEIVAICSEHAAGTYLEWMEEVAKS